ncbi:MAG TPA: DUF1800 domain-containing protein [Pilimelia sp.]|nr:DUF1800 domain-containing protein [Pilimelia sp.]
MPRRSLLASGAAAGAVAATGGSLLAAAPAQAAPATTASLVSADPLLHLLRRATYGPTPAAEAEIRSLGATAWLDRQLAPASIPDAACDALLTRLPLAALDIPGIRGAAAAGQLKVRGYDAMQQLGYAAVARAAWSERQLFEVMVDFWSNHLNVTCPFGDAWDSRVDYDRAVVRKHALGSFADLLKASARHPAMLSYLDNKVSTKTRPNENYGRELLELHTVGLVHTEADVQNAARLLTGLTVDKATGLYKYDATRHAIGAVQVLAFAHANATAAGGEAAALALLDYLAMHPATAQMIARKLCVRFVSDEPPAALVDRLAGVYLAQKSAIAPVLRALFTSAEFAASVGAKVRTPLEDLAATIRVLGISPEPTGITGLKGLYWMLETLGHAPLRWSPPNGYPDVAAAWASPSGYLGRWNGHLNLAAGWHPKTLTRPASLVKHLVPVLPTTYGGLVDALAKRLLGTAVTDANRVALTAFFGKQPTSLLKATDSAVGGSLPYLVALLLDSPYFSVR